MLPWSGRKWTGSRSVSISVAIHVHVMLRNNMSCFEIAEIMSRHAYHAIPCTPRDDQVRKKVAEFRLARCCTGYLNNASSSITTPILPPRPPPLLPPLGRSGGEETWPAGNKLGVQKRSNVKLEIGHHGCRSQASEKQAPFQSGTR